MSEISGSKTVAMSESDRKLASKALAMEAERLRDRAQSMRATDSDIAEALEVQATAADGLRERVEKNAERRPKADESAPAPIKAETPTSEWDVEGASEV